MQVQDEVFQQSHRVLVSELASEAAEPKAERDKPADQEDDAQKADDRVHALVVLQTILQVPKRLLGAERFEEKVPNVDVMQVPDVLADIVFDEHGVHWIVVHCRDAPTSFWPVQLGSALIKPAEW